MPKAYSQDEDDKSSSSVSACLQVDEATYHLSHTLPPDASQSLPVQWFHWQSLHLT
jgi:hypothetical protein